MDLTLILIIASAVWLLAAVVGLGWMAWRMVRRNEEMEAGGSLGRQMFGRRG